MDFDKPFIVTRTGFKQNKVVSEAIEFLKVEEVPREYRKAHIQLLTFFRTTIFPENVDKFHNLVNIFCYGQRPKDISALRDILSDFFSESLSHETSTKVWSLFNVLVFHLALQRMIFLPPTPLFAVPRAGSIVLTPWFKKLPAEIQFWCVASDKRYLEKLSGSLDLRMQQLAWEWYRENESHKQFSSAAVLMRHYFAYQAATKFDLSLFVEVQRLNLALTDVARGPQAALWLYSRLHEEDYLTLYTKKLNDTVVRIGSVPQIYQREIIERRTKAGLSDPYDFSLNAKQLGVDHAVRLNQNAKSGRLYKQKFPTIVRTEYGDARYRPGIAPIPQGCSVYELVNKKFVRFDSYFLTDKALGSFRPEKLYETYPKSLWLAHQKDFLGDGYEKNTKKTKAGSLRIFNAYIFSYLPWFKENVEPNLRVPECLEDFDPNLFIRNTHSFLLRLDPNAILPVTLPTFFEKCADVGAEGGKANVNALQAGLKNISAFFDSYINLEGLSVPNPMSLAPEIRGYSYAEAQKKKVDYDYWWLLREFLIAFSYCSLRARRDLVEKELSREAWRKKFREYAETVDISFGNVSLDLSELEGLDNFDPRTVHVFSTFFCFVSQCGIRFSNAFWLDARTFDVKVDAEAKDDDEVEVWINTDKSKLKPFQSHVKFSVIKLLRMLNDIRAKVFSNDAVFYQNYEESKWGEIVPLFRFLENKHVESDVEYFTDALTDLLYSFQSLLKRTGYEFGSYLYPKARGMSLDDFEILKATRTQAPIKTFIIDEDDVSQHKEVGENLRPVSLFKYRSAITVHGLRKTFDSFFTMFLDKQVISELYTGQSPETVGYYSSNTLGEYRLAQDVAKSAGLPFVIGKDGKNADEIVEDIKKKGLPSKSLMMSAVNIDDFDLNEEYKRAPDREISVNRTHICPYSNVCPKKIRAILDGQKLCGICPAALSFPSDAPAIAATIRKIGDQIADLSTSINSNELTKSERGDFQEKRMRLISEFSSWMVRHDQLIQMTNGEILLGEDGTEHYREKLVYHKPGVYWSVEKKNIWRIIETSDAKTLQSNRLKITAQRYARDMISKINPELMERIHTQLDNDPVKAAALFVEKTALLEGVSLDEVVRSIEEHTQKGSAESLKKLIGMSDGE
ncbi:hypothetical protein [Marinobacter sp.]|uniref:hypothetical protein n=3 Tax=unclassified Marinobacter TaxID=83889 RepID=UPI000C9601DF|nr:hypothetical protein [Marinobacter sp.]MAB50393.1 hypothetical protein [Marinobacter sp.]